MGRQKKIKDEVEPLIPVRPAQTREARENQLIALAEQRAEQQLLDGTASSQVITHYLKLGTTRELLERENLKKQNELLVAKVEALQSSKNVEELYSKVISMMKRYNGIMDDEDED